LDNGCLLGSRWLRDDLVGWRSHLGSPFNSPCPDKHTIFLVYSQFFGVDEFLLDVLQVRVIEVKPSFQRTIGDPFFSLEQFEDLGEHLIEGHGEVTLPLSMFPLLSVIKMPQSGSKGKVFW